MSQRLVHIVDEVSELAAVTELTMVITLDGFLDAGNAAVLAAGHLESLSGEAGGGKVVATFDVDQFHDYRARRPAMSFVRDHYEDYDAPRLVVRLLHDSGGTPYLLMRGPEPDNRWEAFCAAVREVVEQLRRDPRGRARFGADGGARTRGRSRSPPTPTPPSC